MGGEGETTPDGFVKDAFRFCWDRLANVLKITEMFPAAYEAAQDAYKNVTIVYTIRSDKDVNFTGALVQNAKQDAALAGLASNKIRIKRVKAQSDQNLDWQYYFWKTSTTDDTDLDIDSFCGRVTIDSIQGEQIAGANQYYYDNGRTDLPYECLDGTFVLNASLVNRSAIAKIAGATGENVLEVEYEPDS
jgi:hypothetical protein